MDSLVSVIVPSLNRPDFLRAALQSVENQTFRDFEVIVQDNGSAIDISPVVAEFPSLRSRVYRNKTTLPQTQNIALAISRATGKYVAVLCDDDLWQPSFLSTLVPGLDQRADCVLAFGNVEFIDDSGLVLQSTTKKCSSWFGLHLLKTGYYKPFEHIATMFRSISMFSGCVFRRSEIDLSLVPPGLTTNSDLYFAFLAARSGRAAYYNDAPLFCVRFHSGTITFRGNRDPKEILVKHESHIVLWDAMLRDPLARLKSYYYFKRASQFGLYAVDLLKQGQWLEGFRQIMKTSGLRLAFYYFYFLYYVRSVGITRRLMP